MGNYENSAEVWRREGLTEDELRAMGTLAMEATEELKKTTIRKETVLLGAFHLILGTNSQKLYKKWLHIVMSLFQLKLIQKGL